MTRSSPRVLATLIDEIAFKRWPKVRLPSIEADSAVMDSVAKPFDS